MEDTKASQRRGAVLRNGGAVLRGATKRARFYETKARCSETGLHPRNAGAGLRILFELIWNPFGTHWEPIWNPFGTIWNPFGSHLDPIWKPIGTHLEDKRKSEPAQGRGATTRGRGATNPKGTQAKKRAAAKTPRGQSQLEPVWNPFGTHLEPIWELRLSAAPKEPLNFLKPIWNPFGHHLELIWKPFGFWNPARRRRSPSGILEPIWKPLGIHSRSETWRGLREPI